MGIEEFSQTYNIPREDIEEYMAEKKTFFNKHPLENGKLPIVALKALEEKFKVNEVTASATNISNAVQTERIQKQEEEKAEVKKTRKPRKKAEPTPVEQQKVEKAPVEKPPELEPEIPVEKTVTQTKTPATDTKQKAAKDKQLRQRVSVKANGQTHKITIVKDKDMLTSTSLSPLEMRQILTKTEIVSIEKIAFMDDTEVSSLFNKKVTGVKTKDAIYIILK